MKMKFKKFKLSKKAILNTVFFDASALILYIICLEYLQIQDARCYVTVNILSNILLVIMSIASASILSTILIDVKSKNSLYNEILTSDVLSAPQFYSALSKDNREQMLRGLEGNLYFSNCPVKEDMYRSVRKKINSYDGEGGSNQYFLESCVYNIRCQITGSYFKKTILKSIDLRSYTTLDKVGFLLCSTDAPILQDCAQSSVISLYINGVEKNIDDVIETRTVLIHGNAFCDKSGYVQRSSHSYKGNLHLSPDKPNRIEVTYETAVPLYDTFYSCRTPYPCHKFDLTYMLVGQLADKYSLSVCAFGFLDDAKSTPNQKDSMPEISIKFDNWIFPLDGVSVSMIKHDIKT